MPKSKVLRITSVIETVGLSRGSIYRLISEGKFPKQIKLSTQAAGWLESEVNDWLESRIAESRGQGEALS